MKLNSSKGFTLLELILTLALFSIVLAVGLMILNISNKPLAIVNQEVDLQTNTRRAITSITDYITKASAIFIHGNIESVFTDNEIYPPNDKSNEIIIVDEAFITNKNINKKDEFLSAIEKYKGWNFIVFSDDGKELREFTYREENNKGYYELRRLIDKQITDTLDISYEIDFKKNSPNYNDNYLSFTFTGKISNEIEPMVITTEVQAYNTLQVVDRSGYNPGRVLFFRESLDSQAAVAMVLDTSGSMSGRTTFEGKNTTKIEALKKSAKKLIDSFADLENTEVSLIPFSTNANDPQGLKSVKANYSQLINDIDRIKASGGTNVGDGIRRAYHILKKYNDENLANEEASKYLIIIMDGVPTYGTINQNEGDTKSFDSNMGKIYIDESDNFYYHYRTEYFLIFPVRWHYRKAVFKLNDGNINSESLIGTGSETDDNIEAGIRYISAIEKELGNIKNLKIFLVGLFTEAGQQNENSKEKKNFSRIENILSKPGREVDGYIAADGDKLNLAITEIEESILGNYWRIYGPGE